MKGTQISNTRRQGKHSGLRTDKTQWVATEMAAMAPGRVQLNIFAWNQKLTKDVKDGQLEKAMQLFQQMQQEGMSPDKFTFVQVIKACAGLGRLEDGRLVHKQLIQSGYKSDVFVCNSLVDMYAKCGSIEEAWTVLEKMPSQNVATWTTMILGHVQCQQWQKALELFEKMQQEGVQPDSVTFVGVLKACVCILALEEGRCVHQQIVEFGWDSDVFVGNSLVDMYAKCGSIEDAWRVFNKMPSRNTWNAMVLGHVKCGQGQKALELFQQMQLQGVQPNSVTFVGVLKACANVAVIEEGRCVHQQVIQSGLESAVFVGSSSVDMYAKCGSIEDAGKVFKKMPSQDVVSWTAMILGHVQCREGQKAFELFQQMQQEGV
jgi:pentatricopeptide repeat protein